MLLDFQTTAMLALVVISVGLSIFTLVHTEIR